VRVPQAAFLGWERFVNVRCDHVMNPDESRSAFARVVQQALAYVVVYDNIQPSPSLFKTSIVRTERG
jgi:hypothetical protein